MTPVQATIAWLTKCREARAAGYPVSYTTDPEWLLDMAVARRAGWPDDPTTSRGTAMPIKRWARWMVVPIYQYPKSAAGDWGYRTLEQLARKVNTPRVIVREHEVPPRYRKRLAHRIFTDD